MTKSKIPIGFQLYTVRSEFSRNVPGTLKKIKELGYEGVEFWAYSGTAKVYKNYSAAQLRKLLDDNGLGCFGMHLELKALEPKNLQRTIENNLTLGSQYLNVVSAKDKMKAERTITELADFLNETASKCEPHDLFVGYHAHDHDFIRIKGRFAWDLLFSRTVPEVNMQMDVGNCLSGKGDPVGMLKKFPGQARTVHLKEYKDKTFESDYFDEVFRLCETLAGTQLYIVEMGGTGGRGFDVPGDALKRLRAVGNSD